jgi:hypothetical protein
MNSTPKSVFFLKLIFSLSVLLYYGGCSTQEIFIQDLQVAGPLNQTPIHYTDGDSTRRFRLSGRISFPQDRNLSGRIDKHTYVNAKGVMQVDTIHDGSSLSYQYYANNNPYMFSGNNLGWSVPSSNYAVDMSYLLSSHWVFDAGVDYSRISQSEYLSEHIGFGVNTYDENFAFRADFGVRFSEVSYDLSYVVLTYSGDSQPNPGEADVRFGEYSGKNNNVDLYYGIMLNSKKSDWPVNVFLKAAVDREELVDYTIPTFWNYANNSPNASYSATLIDLTPGLSLQVDPSLRLNAGVAFIWNLSLLNEEKPAYVVPVIQFDWSL